MKRTDIVFVGGGLAAASAAETYRKTGGTGSVAIISADADRPVHRPPLSKEYLRGEAPLDAVYVHPTEFYDEQQIDLHLGTIVTGIDLAGHSVLLADGEPVAYERLVLATGARPRRLSVPGCDRDGVFYLRSLASSDELRSALPEVREAVIIGAGFIGMEVAASLTRRGIACTVVEMAPRVWPRLVPPVVAEFVQSYFEARGVRFRLGVGVDSLDGDERVRGVRLADGETLPADIVIAGVGAALVTNLAEDAGLAVDRGITVDAFFRTSHPDVYAIGDVANFPDPIGGRGHLEHWDNALQQGRTLGKTLAGRPEQFNHVASFFSDLFDLSLNMIGYPLEWDDIVLRGDPAGGAFTTVYLRQDIVRAALLINDDQYFGSWERLIAERLSGADIPSILADPSSDPAALLTA